MGGSSCSQSTCSRADDAEGPTGGGWGPRTREDATKEEVLKAGPPSLAASGASGAAGPGACAGGPVAPPDAGESGRLAVTIRSTQPDKVSPNYKRCTRSARPLTKDESMAVLLGSVRCRGSNDPDGSVLNAYSQEKPNAIYKDINKALRTDDGLDKHGGFIFLLKQAMKNKGREVGWYQGQVRRDMRVDAQTLAEFKVLAQEPGSAFLWAGFVSTTTLPPNNIKATAFRGNIRFEINLNKDASVPDWDKTRAVNIRQWSDYPAEDEILLMPYSALRVVKGESEKRGEGDAAHWVFVLHLESCPRESLDASAAASVKKRRENQKFAGVARSFELGPEMTLPVIAGQVVPGHDEGTALLEEPSRDSALLGRASCAEDGEKVEILETSCYPTGYARVRTAAGVEGWMNMNHLHVQLAGELFEGDLPNNSFVLSHGREVVHGTTIRGGDGANVRKKPSDDLGHDNNAYITLKDGDPVIIREVSNADGKPGYDYALIARPGGGPVANLYDTKRGALGWVKTQNLHVQLA